MPKLNYCSDHDETQVIYHGDECPMCRLRLQLEERSDNHQGVLEDNVRGLFKRIDRLERDMSKVLQATMPQDAPRRKWFARKQKQNTAWLNALSSDEQG